MCAWTESAAQNNQPRVGSGVEIAELPEESPPGEQEDAGGGQPGGRAPSRVLAWARRD